MRDYRVTSRTLVASLMLLVFGVACGGGASPAATPSLAITVNGRSASNVILLPQYFLTFGSYIATLGTIGGPGGSVQWSVASGTAAVLGSTDPSYLSDSPTPPPNDTFVMIAPPVNHVLPTASAKSATW